MTIKKSIQLIAIILFTNNLSAQTTVGVDKPMQFGFKISPNLTWAKIKSGPAEGNGVGLGFSYGLMADFKLSENAFFSPEILITSMKNSINLKDSFYQGDGSVGSYYNNIEQNFKFQYLQIPLTIKMKTNAINGMRYTFQAGVAPSVLLSRNFRIKADRAIGNNDEWVSPNGTGNDAGDFVLDPNNPNSKSFSNNIGLFRVPLVLGAGIEYNLSGNTALVAGIRWDNGFTDIFRDKNVTGINNYLGLTVGILF